MTTYEVPLSPAQSSFIDEDDDESHNCRRCDLPISEGHAYELGSDRWHMYCFSCSKCSKLLGTSSNFLVLGTGDLICSDCSYACNACGKKIDDLAILTGDQAYCSTCFCCRNCKKRIEDLKYARTSKGLFCMSCHEKLLDKKRRHESEKRLKQNTTTRIPTAEKSLPKVPQESALRVSDEHLRVASPSLSSSSSTPGHTVVGAGTTISVNDIPPRSPERVHVALEPSPVPAQQEESRILDPPVAVSPMRFPSHLSPSNGQDLNSLMPEDTEVPKASTNTTPKQKYLNVQTPERARSRSPLRQAILTPNEKNRQAVVVGDISSSSSNNILSSYIKESPPPKVPPPRVPDDDFIDMEDSDEDGQKYTRKPPGFSEIRHSDSIPTGLNIQGLPSFDEHFDKEPEVKAEEKNAGGDPVKLEQSQRVHPGHQHHDSISSQPERLNYEEKENSEMDPPGSAKSWKSTIMSPNSQMNKRSTMSSNNELSKSRSIRSPKNFLNFRKHKKSISQTSVENYKISSPLMDSKGMGTFEESMTFHTPKLGQPGSPYQGAALFTTPPVEHLASQRRQPSSHGRSRSDANGLESHDLAQAELELRSLRTEIRDLKVTKHGIVKEIADLTAQRDELNLEVVQLQAKLEQLKTSQSSKSSLDNVTETFPREPTPITAPPSSTSQTLPHTSTTTSSGITPTSIDVAEQVQVVENRAKPSKGRFWKRFGAKAEGMPVSQSNYSLSHLLNDGKHPQISAPMLRSEEADELGGNDNRKLMSTKGYSLENGNSSTSVVTSGSSGLIMSDLFNSSLEMRAQYEKRHIPLIVTRLISEVEKRGLDCEGIYRKNGATSQMSAILKAFNNLYQAETSHELESALSECDVNAITSSLKRYLYFHLPEPVITMNVYEQYIGISKLSDDEEKSNSLADLITKLPQTNARTLVSLLRHFKKVESYSGMNRMNYHNLAVVFAPTLARVSNGEKELMDMQPRNAVTEFLLKNQDTVLNRLEKNA